MSQEYTIEQAINRNKPDKYGNGTYDVKFAEYETMVYASFKTPPKQGDKKFGDIVTNEYGARFKSASRPDFQGGQPQAQSPQLPGVSYNRPPQAPKKSDDERSDDIRWGLCIKEGSMYVAKYRPDLSPDKWAIEVNEYANALWKLSGGPDKPTGDKIRGTDTVLTPEEEDQIDVGTIPF